MPSRQATRRRRSDGVEGCAGDPDEQEQYSETDVTRRPSHEAHQRGGHRWSQGHHPAQCEPIGEVAEDWLEYRGASGQRGE